MTPDLIDDLDDDREYTSTTDDEENALDDGGF